MANYTSFTEVGFPIIATVFFVIGIFMAISSIGMDNLMTMGKLKLLQSGFVLITSIFLVWGPVQMRSLAIQLFILAIASLFTDKSKAISLFVVVFSVITFLCVTGTGLLFGYSAMLHEVSDAQCIAFFGGIADSARCDGYLMFLRVFSVFAIMRTGYIMLDALFNYGKK